MRRVTILTGSSRGLGAALARLIAADGGRLVTIARSDDAELPARANLCNTEHIHIPLDLGDAGAVRDAASRIEGFCRDHDSVRLIQNAGIVAPMGLAQQLDDLNAINRAYQINITAPIFLTARVLASTASLTDRRVMLISSGAGRSPTAGWGVYCSTKAALDRFAEVVALEQGDRLRIASIAPGVIDTGMQEEIRSAAPERFPALGRFIGLHTENQLASPETVAKRLLRHFESDAFGQKIIDDIRHYPT